MTKTRVRFAPSPTGPLHIGGVRTALYNYLLAKKHGGAFILRIEDTDQTRYVRDTEKYIVESLEWCGLTPDEGPGFGGEYGPYRQSERKDLYHKYAHQLVESGFAYYAFDTPEELEAKRQSEKEKGNHSFKYDARLRTDMKNSLTLSEAEVARRLESGDPYVIRLKVPDNETIIVPDLIRGEVAFQSHELDDKVLLKSDGMPTYHLANIVDDRHMEISHVIRGEEWLPSTAHHVLLYQAMGWETEMPKFAHLPLILKPTGKGKLSKRDGTKLGIPVFPLSWDGGSPEESFKGFREFGFVPEAVNNFLAFLGWNPGTEQEIFSLDELCRAFSIDNIGKAGARFDFDKAKWFNQQYIMAKSGSELAEMARPFIEAQGHKPTDDYLARVCDLLKERVTFLTDFWESGRYFFEEVEVYDEKMIRKKWKTDNRGKFNDLYRILKTTDDFSAGNLEALVKNFIGEKGLSFGEVFPILRIALSGTTKGPGVFEMMELLGRETVLGRLSKGFDYFDSLFMDYKDKITDIIKRVPVELIDLEKKRERGRKPTQASSNFITNREQGDWAEKLVLKAINETSKSFKAVQYGKSDDIIAGERGFDTFYEAYQDELDTIGKRPDILIYAKEDYQEEWNFNISEMDMEQLDKIVPKAKAGIEIRSSSFLINKYDEAMRKKVEKNTKIALETKDIILTKYRDLLNTPKRNHFIEILAGINERTLSATNFTWRSLKSSPRLIELSEHFKQLKSAIKEVQKRDFLSITPKIEDLKVVYKWIQTYNVPHFYFQVFFDKVFGIPYEQILTLISESENEGVKFFIEGDVKNQNKLTVKINSKEGSEIAGRVEMPTHQSKMKELDRGRLLFYETFKGGTAYLDVGNLLSLLGIEKAEF